jgi:hypothetical protein
MFELWTETEHLTGPYEGFANILVTLPDRSQFALNVWTFDYFDLVRSGREVDRSLEDSEVKFLLPPDLVVWDLSREELEIVLGNMLEQGLMNDSWRTEPPH